MSDSNLDIAFCVDNTGSMGTYIYQVQSNIKNIIEQIVRAEKANVRFGLVHYRDHKDAYVVKRHDFTDDIDKVHGYVRLMEASGGGDGPEAVAAGFRELNKLEWRKFSTKIAVFIADAPPHGVEPTGDDYPNGDPQGIDPIEEVKQLVSKEVILYSVGCEPAINSYVNARSFMKAVADMTGGKYLSLAQANILSDIIIYGAREEINLEKYATKIEEEVSKVQNTNPKMDTQSVYAMAASNLQALGIATPQMAVDEVVDKKAFASASLFSNASNLKDIKKELYATPQYQAPPQVFSSSPLVPSPAYPSPLFPSASSPYGGPPPPPSPATSLFGPPPPPASSPYGGPPPSFSSPYGGPPASSPTLYASPSYGSAPPQMQQAQMNVAPISVEQVQRLYERKQNAQKM